MTDFEAKLERFETLAAECDLISKLTDDAKKRELYLRLGLHYRELADDMRIVIAANHAAEFAEGKPAAKYHVRRQ